MELTFKILAVILAGIAAYFLWQSNADYAFAAAVLGAVSFFLSVRVEVKKRVTQREIEREEEAMRREEEKEIEEEETPVLNEIPANEKLGNEQRTVKDEQKI